MIEKSHDGYAQKFLFCIVGFLCFSAYMSIFFPGYITADTILILRMGTGIDILSNWHPPFLSYIWGAIYELFQNVAFIWMVQILLFIGFGYVWAKRLAIYPIGLLALASIVLWPSVMTNMGAIWKDCWTIVATLATVAFARQAWETQTLTPIVLSIIAAVTATLFRIDYAVVVLPVVLALGFHLANMRRIKRAAFGVGIAFVAFFGGMFLVKGAFDLSVRKELNPWLPIAIWDIAGAQIQDGAEIKSLKVAHMRLAADLYNCRTSDPLVFGVGGTALNLPETPIIRPRAEEAKDISSLWLRTIQEHPLGYVKHRGCVLRQFLGLGVKTLHYPYPFGIPTPSEFGHNFVRTKNNISAYFFFDRNANGPFWRYWIYLAVVSVIGIGLIIMKTRWNMRTRGGFVLVIVLTVFAAASRGMVLPAADFRYGLWIAIGTLIAAFETLDLVAAHFLRRQGVPFRPVVVQTALAEVSDAERTRAE